MNKIVLLLVVLSVGIVGYIYYTSKTTYELNSNLQGGDDLIMYSPTPTTFPNSGSIKVDGENLIWHDKLTGDMKSKILESQELTGKSGRVLSAYMDLSMPSLYIQKEGELEVQFLIHATEFKNSPDGNQILLTQNVSDIGGARKLILFNIGSKEVKELNPKIDDVQVYEHVTFNSPKWISENEIEVSFDVSSMSAPTKTPRTGTTRINLGN